MLACSHALRTHEVCKTHPSDEPCLNALVAALMPRLLADLLASTEDYAPQRHPMTPVYNFGFFYAQGPRAGGHHEITPCARRRSDLVRVPVLVQLYTIVPYGYLRVHFTVILYTTVLGTM